MLSSPKSANRFVSLDCAGLGGDFQGAEYSGRSEHGLGRLGRWLCATLRMFCELEVLASDSFTQCFDCAVSPSRFGCVFWQGVYLARSVQRPMAASKIRVPARIQTHRLPCKVARQCCECPAAICLDQISTPGNKYPQCVFSMRVFV